MFVQLVNILTIILFTIHCTSASFGYFPSFSLPEVIESSVFEVVTKNWLKQNQSTNRFVPYQRNSTESSTLQQPEQNYLQVNRPPLPTNPIQEFSYDFCISFNYTASTGPLFVSTNISIALSPQTIEFPSTTSNSLRSICASTLTPNVNTLGALYFWFANNSNQPIDKLDNSSNFVQLNSNTQPMFYDTFAQGLFLNTQTGELLPDNRTSNRDAASEPLITITIPFLDLHPTKTKDAKLIQKVEFRSLWFKMSKARPNNFQITFNQTSDLPDFAQVKMFLLASDGQKLFEKQLDSSPKLYNFKIQFPGPLPNPIENVQIVFRFQIDFSKVKDKSNKRFQFVFRQFSANDPCVDENGEKLKCNSHQYILVSHKEFKCTCECDTGYSKKDNCKSKEYCAKSVHAEFANRESNYYSGWKLCQKLGLKCVSNYEIQSFECDCDNSSLQWNPIAMSCFPKVVVKCPPNQIHIKQIDGKVQCVCRYGMRVNTQTNACVPLCSDELNRECDQKGAICRVQANNSTNCECESDKVAFLANTERPDDWICMDKCSVMEQFDQKKLNKCPHFSKCDPLHVYFQNYTNTQEKIVSTKSTAFDITHFSDGCKCDIGFQMHSMSERLCRPSVVPTLSLKGIQFEIYPNWTKQNEERKSLEQTISDLFGVPYGQVHTKCKFIAPFQLSCDIYFSTLKSAHQFKKEFLHVCILISRSNGKQCAFFNGDQRNTIAKDYYKAQSVTGDVILNVDSLKTPQLFDNFCQNNQQCSENFENSICKPSKIVNGMNFFDCVCDLEKFDVMATEWIGDDNTRFKGQKCRPKNLCQSAAFNNSTVVCKCPSKSQSWCQEVAGQMIRIVLNGNQYSDLKVAFRQISLQLEESGSNVKDFDHLLILNNSAIGSLDANAFGDFRFRQIEIQNCTNLTRVQVDAFNHTKQLLKLLKLDGIGLSEEFYKDFFDSLVTANSMEVLKLHNFHKVFPSAFKQKNLYELYFDSQQIELPFRPFYDLDSIRVLYFKSSFINITKHAFRFDSIENKTLDIYLEGMFSSDKKVFSQSHRPLRIHLFLDKLTAFDVDTFKSMWTDAKLAKQPAKIVFHGKLIEAQFDRCQLVWLFKSNFTSLVTFKDDPDISLEYFDQLNCNREVQSEVAN